MVQFAGTYEFVSEDNYAQYLKSFGLTDEQVKKEVAVKTPLVIKAISEDSITLTYNNKDVTFPLGKEYDHTLTLGHKIKTTATVNGNTVTFHSKLTEDGSVTDDKVWTITETGITSASTNSLGTKYTRTYKRV